MRLSVVMPCWNTARFIGTQLEALARQKVDDPWEVIMADNGSSDDSRRIAEAFAAKLPLRIVDASQRRGAAHARNFGVLKAIGDVVVFCDSDDEVGEGFLAAMGRALRQHELVACRFDFARLNHNWVSQSRGAGQCDGPGVGFCHATLPYAGSGGLGVKRETHHRMGGFDETLQSQEDTDYCLRLQLAGIPLHYASDALVHVRMRPDAAGMFRQAAKWAEYGVYVRQRYQAPGTPVENLRGRVLPIAKHLLWRLLHVRNRAGFGSWIWFFAWQWGWFRGLCNVQRGKAPCSLTVLASQP